VPSANAPTPIPRTTVKVDHHPDGTDRGHGQPDGDQDEMRMDRRRHADLDPIGIRALELPADLPADDSELDPQRRGGEHRGSP